MPFSPLDIRRQTFPKKLLGYDPATVVQFLELLSAEFEKLQAENQSQGRRLQDLETSLRKYDEMERFMQEALIEARKTGEVTKYNAEKEGGLIIREAEVKATQILAATQQHLARVQGDLELLKSQKETYLVRFKSLLRSQLELINLLGTEEEKPGREASDAAVAEMEPLPVIKPQTSMLDFTPRVRPEGDTGRAAG